MKTSKLLISIFVFVCALLSACGSAPTSTSADPAAITQGFWDAIAAKNMDAAMAFVAEDPQAFCVPFYKSSTADIRFFISDHLDQGETYKISDLKVVSGNTATYVLKTYINGTLSSSRSGSAKFQVKDGKIVRMEFPN